MFGLFIARVFPLPRPRFDLWGHLLGLAKNLYELFIFGDESGLGLGRSCSRLKETYALPWAGCSGLLGALGVEGGRSGPGHRFDRLVMGCCQVAADPQSLLGPLLLAPGRRLVILLCLDPRWGLLGNGGPRFLWWLAGGFIN